MADKVPVGVTLIGSLTSVAGKYPLLEALLVQKGLNLKGTYTNRDVAEIFAVSTRTTQEWSRNGRLKPRSLPGRARFLSEDLEEFLRNSHRRDNDEQI
jgi:Helix-turn-helix domain